MPVTRNFEGSNMYPWVTHMITHHRGACPHRCGYCYVKSGRAASHYSGPLRLKPEELNTPMAEPGTYFIEHMCDLFAAGVKLINIAAILNHCRRWPNNRYVFQTKNFERVLEIAGMPTILWPVDMILGLTLESDRWHDAMGSAPHPKFRVAAFQGLRECRPDIQTFITIEPILNCNPFDLAQMVARCRPAWVNIGADSKGHGLDEPDEETVEMLIGELTRLKVPIRQKHNLGRLIKNTESPA